MATKRFGGTEKNGKSDSPVGVPGHTASSQLFRHAQSERVRVALGLKIGLTIASIYRIDTCSDISNGISSEIAKCFKGMLLTKEGERYALPQ